MNKIVLEANTFPRVDIDFMNNTHFDELVLVKDLGEVIAKYQQSEKVTDEELQQVTQSLKGWVEHSYAHFLRENTLMKEVEFPMYQVHYSEHERVLAEMDKLVSDWQANNDIDVVADYVFSIWPTWFNAHVNSMDLMTAQFAVMNGYSPNSAPPPYKRVHN